MGLFDIFKKSKKHKLPESYEGVISRDDYNEVIEIAIDYHKKNGLEITSIEEGTIIIDLDDTGNQQHRYLDNLVRVLASNDKEKWREIICTHFDKLKYNSSALDYLYKDFDYAKQFLRVLIKGENFHFGDSSIDIKSEYVCQVDFPKTLTLLIIEFENQFHYVRKDKIGEWEISESELLKVAIENIPDEEVEAKQYEFANKFTVYIFFSGDFSASLILDIVNRADYSIGTFGSLIAIPTKGTAYAHPIESGDILELIEVLNPTIIGFYNDDPGSITTNYYWYFDNKFQVFPKGEDEKGTYITMPDDLFEILNEKR
jgi:hypothetical protein